MQNSDVVMIRHA